MLLAMVILKLGSWAITMLPDFVDSEKDKMLELIASRINNKRSYAISRCIEEMCCFENYAVSRFGDEATCEGIRYRKLSRHYRKVLQESPIELFYCGSASRKKVCDFLRDVFSTLPRGELQDDIGTEIRMNAIESQPRTFVEEMEVAQTNLVIGWRLGECMENPDFPALYVFNELFGGSPSSRLFMNVREKLSLCYYASSLMDLRKGILLASAGVKKENCEAAREEIYTQLEAIQNGDFTEEDLETAKSGVISDLRSIPDTQIALESFWLTQAVTGADFGPLELAELIREVTKEQIIELASCVDCDMVYILQNAADTEMEEEDDKN